MIGSRVQTCPTHKVTYPQVRFPNLGTQAAFFVGDCPECDTEAQREREVTEFLKAHETEIAAEAQTLIEQAIHQTLIEARTEKDLDADVAEFKAERRLLWRDYEEAVEWNAILRAIEDRMRAEFLSSERK